MANRMTSAADLSPLPPVGGYDVAAAALAWPDPPPQPSNARSSNELHTLAAKELWGVLTPSIARDTLRHLATGHPKKGRIGAMKPATTNAKCCWLSPGKYYPVTPIVPPSHVFRPKVHQAVHRLSILAWHNRNELELMLFEDKEASHLCGEASCFRPDHIVVEGHGANASRNRCLSRQRQCECKPKCILDIDDTRNSFESAFKDVLQAQNQLPSFDRSVDHEASGHEECLYTIPKPHEQTQSLQNQVERLEGSQSNHEGVDHLFESHPNWNYEDTNTTNFSPHPRGMPTSSFNSLLSFPAPPNLVRDEIPQFDFNVPPSSEPSSMQLSTPNTSGIGTAIPDSGHAPHLPIPKASVLTCSQCPRTFPSATHLKRHQKSHSRYTCSRGCTASFTSTKDCRRHEESIHGRVTVQCDFCSYSGRKDNLRRHMRKHESK